MQSYDIQHHKCSSQEVLAKYQNLIFPEELYNDFSRDRFKELYCSEVLREKRVIGVAIATPRHDGDMQLISFFIKPLFQNKGLGFQLLTSIAKRINSIGYSSIHGNYKTFWSDNLAWEKLLQKSNWQKEQTNLSYIILDRLPKLNKEKWITRFNFPSNAEIRSLNNQKLHCFSNWLRLSTLSHEMPPDIRPNKAINQTNSDCSLLLLIDHDIAGWIIVHDLEEGIGQVSALYIRKKYSKLYPHLGLALIAEAFKRNSTLLNAYFGYRNGNQYMERLIQHRFKDYSTHYQKRRCIKNLP